ncbi:unnamed protein product [Soboliphyme baturini]|uniref:Wiskott-Aldrich syndrome protein family member n=1 Tax=Soboliphyme baturini TaxID=241478 RepID=A0A183JAW2_9BILA|nr:unnamed protein product [Soboliphyme baturini]
MQQYVYDDRMQYGSKPGEDISPHLMDGSRTKYSEYIHVQEAVNANVYVPNNLVVGAPSSLAAFGENLTSVKHGTAAPPTETDQSGIRRNFPPFTSSSGYSHPVKDRHTYAETAFVDRQFLPQQPSKYDKAEDGVYENELTAKVTRWSLKHEGYRLAPVNVHAGNQTPSSVNAYEDQREKSLSPELPPPPPPLLSTEMTNLMNAHITAPPVVPPSVLPISPYSKSVNDPPPPPPPPVILPINGTGGDESAGNSAANDGSKLMSDKKPEDSVIDVRSDLLKAIREGIQLKKVGRQQEQEREKDVLNYGHDVAAILKRRMEDVMGRSESDSSVSDGEVDWDD